MSERKITYQHELPDGRLLKVGDEFNLHGEKGKRYSYIRTVDNDGEVWIDCFGGRKNSEKSRSIFPDRINRVWPK